MKHTRGPWFAMMHPDAPYWGIDAPAAPERTVAGTNSGLNEADARLCAAAPEMMEALEWARNALVGGWNAANVPESHPQYRKLRETQVCIETVQEKIRAAIAKAEGRA